MKSLQESWPEPDASLEMHREQLQAGIGVLRENLILPADERFERAYYLLASGRGQKSAVGAIGDPGSGKTFYGDLLFGIEDRVEIARDDTEETLYGYANPIKPTEFVPGKLKGLRPENPTAYLNEASHLPNTGPLHRLADASEVEVSGQTVPIEDIAMYLTSNFPNGRRVHEFDEALLSRLAILLVTGDHDVDTAAMIQDHNAARRKQLDGAPILPIAGVRRAINEQVMVNYPAMGLGKYVVKLITELNETGLIVPLNPAEGRVGEALYDMSRANMFYDKVAPNSPVTEKELAKVAALTLPTITQLSGAAKKRLQDEAGGRRTSPMEQAIAVRHLIARTAFSALQLEPMTYREREEYLRDAANKYAYASQKAVDFDFHKALDTKLTTEKTMEQPDERRKLFSRRSR